MKLTTVVWLFLDKPQAIVVMYFPIVNNTESIPQSNLVFPRMLNGGLCMYRMSTSCDFSFFSKEF
jgi:hypothetical protein